MALFFEGSYKKWEEKWPTEPPTPQEIQDADGNAERAFTTKKKLLSKYALIKILS